MCLLIVLHRIHADAPLIVAANRDEVLARPAASSAVLQDHGPRILGGHDLVAGGTWLATNEHGVVAGLTNMPMLTRDPAKRSRGELPLAFAQHTSAQFAIDDVTLRARPVDYSPAWLLVGDRDALFLVDMTQQTPQVTPLAAGIHILENRAFGVPSAKVAHVRAALHGVEHAHGDALLTALADVLRDHEIPPGAAHATSGVDGFTRPTATEAACVHAGPYGTRSASIIVVNEGAPRVFASDGPLCTSPLIDRSALLG